jgi:hypothetical protein
MNNPKLQLAMAKLLPDDLEIKPTIGSNQITYHFYWIDSESGARRRILETEWLYVMHLCRKDLTLSQKVNYMNFLRDIIRKANGNKVVSDFDLLDAPFDFQSEAMCKVKGITI